MKRTRGTIISEVLDICANGANKTRIVHQASLNFKIVNPYLEILAKNGMIKTKEKGNRVEYKTTNKGLAFLDNIKEIEAELPW